MSSSQHANPVETVLAHAATIGMDAALQQFGACLSPVEHAALKMLTEDELRVLLSIRSKIGNILPGRSADTNNNNH